MKRADSWYSSSSAMRSAVGEHGRQRVRPRHAGGVQRCLAGRIALDAQIAPLARFGGARFIVFEDHQTGAARAQ